VQLPEITYPIHRVIRYYPQLKLAHGVNSKCASTSINESLRHHKCIHTKFEDCMETIQDYFRFLIVRSPWSRLVSLYHDILTSDLRIEVLQSFNKQGRSYITPLPSFYEFVQLVCDTSDEHANRHYRSQWMSLPPLNPPIHYLARVEYLKIDWKYISGRFSLPPLKQLRKTKHKHHSHYFTDKSAEMVSKRYEDDLRIFRYKYEQSKRIHVPTNIAMIHSGALNFLKISRSNMNYTRRKCKSTKNSGNNIH